MVWDFQKVSTEKEQKQNVNTKLSNRSTGAAIKNK